MRNQLSHFPKTIHDAGGRRTVLHQQLKAGMPNKLVITVAMRPMVPEDGQNGASNKGQNDQHSRDVLNVGPPGEPRSLRSKMAEPSAGP
jgi:hypothetical protein